MTVSSEIDSVNYTLPGVPTPLPVTFRFLEDGDLRVVRAPISGVTPYELVLNTDYSVTGARTQGGGLVTLITPTTAGDQINIDRGNMQRTQLIDYRANDPFPEEDAEDGLDRLTMLLQQAGIDGGRRSLTLFPTDPETGGRYNANGNRIVALADGVDPTDAATVQQVIGAGSGNFIQAGTGAQVRTMQDKVRETVSVLDFIPVGEHAAIKNLTTTYDATANIQAAINSLAFGGRVLFPQGLYRISDVLNVTVAGTTLEGDCNIRTALQMTVNNKGHLLLDTTANNARVTSLRFNHAAGVVPASGVVIDSRGGFNHIDNIVISSGFGGIKFSLGAAQKLSTSDIFNCESYGIWCDSAIDIRITNILMNMGSDTRAPLGCIRLTNQCEGIFVQTVDLLRGVYSLTTDSTTYALGTRPAYCVFSDAYFDSAAQGSLVNNLVESEFIGCWFSGGRTGIGFPGLTLQQSDSVKFTNTKFFNCGSHGLSVANTAKRLSVVNCSANSNSFTTGAGVAHGIFFATGTTDWTIADTTCSNGLYTGTQGYGIFVNTTNDRFSIRDCKLSGNVTGGINDSSAAAAEKYISGNVGYLTQRKFATTVPVGTNNRVGSHSLPFTPEIQDFRVQANESAIAKGVTSIWIDTITSTQFTIRTNANVTGSDLAVGVEIRSKGA